MAAKSQQQCGHYVMECKKTTISTCAHNANIHYANYAAYGLMCKYALTYIDNY